MSASAGERVLDSLASRIEELDNLIDKGNDARNVHNDVGPNRFEQRFDTEQYVDSMKNENTFRKTKADVNLFSKYLSSVGEGRSIEEIIPRQLDGYLARFFLNVRKVDKTEYEPDSIKCFQSSINRYLKERKYGHNIMTDIEFQHSRDVLASKRKDLKSMGKGNKTYQADPLSKEELDILYQKGEMGSGSPQSLINTVWFNNTVHFGLRSRKAHVEMKWGDIELKEFSCGEEFLEYNERATKTRTGITSDSRAFPPKMFARPGNSRCPVFAYKEYAKRRPESASLPESPFYLSVNTNYKTYKSSVWFSTQPMGKNKIGNLMKEMCGNAEIKGRKVNHTARKTSVKTLLHGGVEATQIMQVTGHKNVHSINNCASASLEQQKHMSHLLSDISCNKENVVQDCARDSVSDLKQNSIVSVDNVQDSVFDDNDEGEMLSVADKSEVEKFLNDIEKYEEVPATNNKVLKDQTCENIFVTVPSNIPSVVDLHSSLANTSNLSNTCASTYFLTGAHVEGGVTINMYAKSPNLLEPTRKKKRIRVIDSDSEGDNANVCLRATMMLCDDNRKMTKVSVFKPSIEKMFASRGLDTTVTTIREDSN